MPRVDCFAVQRLYLKKFWLLIFFFDIFLGGWGVWGGGWLSGCSSARKKGVVSPMDYGHLMMKLSAERLIWKQADLPRDWNGYISVLSVVDSDQIWNRLTWIVTMVWSPHTLGFIDTTTQAISSALGLLLLLFLFIYIYFLDAFCTSFWIRPFDHPESIIRTSCEVISLLVFGRLVRKPICQPLLGVWCPCRISTCPALTTPKADHYDYIGELGG